jgi:hypothetical protein
MGRDAQLQVWAARDNRNLEYDGNRFADMTVDRVPGSYTEQARRTIEAIDVLWLRGNNYVAAFEIEATTSILSGLARMGDLLALLPGFHIPLFIVAPEARRGRVFDQLKRPLFREQFDPPLHTLCRYISFEALESGLDQLGQFGAAVDPRAFLDQLAEEAP